MMTTPVARGPYGGGKLVRGNVHLNFAGLGCCVLPIKREEIRLSPESVN